MEVTLEGDGAPRVARSTFSFALSTQDEEDLRWYLEDYLQYPQEPAPAIARRVEGRLAEVGMELFAAVFQKSDDARDLWTLVRERLAETRVEIVTGVAEANSIPWELLRDPKTGSPLALTAQSFVRAQPDAALHLPLPLPVKEKEKFRILLVLCRPRGPEDVPFRSVASRLVKGLDEATREAYDLDLLRPPTFEQLGKVLRRAKDEGRPYHVVHFDGHGAYLETTKSEGLNGLPEGLSSLVPSGARPGRHGYLLFENPKFEQNLELVDGTSLGKLLAETQVPILVLNACRSAHAEPAAQPKAASDTHSQVRAFGSLAQEVMDAGTAGVVAMRYNVYVVTAAQLVAELYAALGRGKTLGEAVALARKNLAENPLREIAFAPIPLQDWPVPVVYEAAPMRLFPEAEEREGSGLRIRVAAGAAAVASSAAGALDPGLPLPPNAGFYGRDETLLALDRAFDHDGVVLLHAYAGSGKTTTATEFARWYALTGGVEGPVLFTSFEHYLPLPRVLDRIGQTFGGALKRAGVHWLALDDTRRREVTIQVLAQVPVLWIWDNVEPVAGFPAGNPSAWSAEEQAELAAFLRAARKTKAKFLLTSRRGERAWLEDLPTHVAVPPMPLTESLQLARALADKRGRDLSEIEDWRPLLNFAGGNPLAVTVLVGEALRQSFTTRAELESFVARLRAGEAAFPDETGQGRSRSLGASLAYGFEQAFSGEERRQLALLHVFQGFVDVDVLCRMGHPEILCCLPEVRGLTREKGLALLDRATEVGLLTAHGGGYYSIHPALPWFFLSLFEEDYPEGGLAAVRSFVEAVGALGDYYLGQYAAGNQGVLTALQAEEANLLHARHLARLHGWWDRLISTMQGLRMLYRHTGRRAEWKRLVEEIVPDFVDVRSDGPLPGREKNWSLVTDYRALLATEELRWVEAERLQTLRIAWNRQRAAIALDLPVEKLEGGDRNAIRALGASLHQLGEIRRELGQADCVSAYEEALKLFQQIGEQAGEAACAFSLGDAFKNLSTPRDLDKAERWYRKSLDLYAKWDRIGRAKCYGQLGAITRQRFQQAQAANRPEAELFRFLNEAARLYREALRLLPPDAVDDLAVTHKQIGAVYADARDLDRALPHFRQAIQLEEMQADLYDAALIRFSVAVHLLGAERRADALQYAEAALRGFESYGERAAEGLEGARGLIALIRAGSTLPRPLSQSALSTASEEE